VFSFLCFLGGGMLVSESQLLLAGLVQQALSIALLHTQCFAARACAALVLRSFLLVILTPQLSHWRMYPPSHPEAAFS
jgi:hypothetical protein